MAKASIHDVARAIVCEQLGVSDAAIMDAKELRELPGVESIKILRAITRLEARFQIELEDEIVFHVHTMRELLALIEQKLATVQQPSTESRACELEGG